MPRSRCFHSLGSILLSGLGRRDTSFSVNLGHRHLRLDVSLDVNPNVVRAIRLFDPSSLAATDAEIRVAPDKRLIGVSDLSVIRDENGRRHEPAFSQTTKDKDGQRQKDESNSKSDRQCNCGCSPAIPGRGCR